MAMLQGIRLNRLVVNTLFANMFGSLLSRLQTISINELSTEVLPFTYTAVSVYNKQSMCL